MADLSVLVRVDGVGDAVSAFDKLAKAAMGFGKDGEGVGDALGKLASKMHLNIDAMSIAESGFNAIKSVIGGMIGAVSDAAMEFDNIRDKLDGTFGVGGPSDAALKWAQTFAKDTPLGIAEVTDRMIRLKNAGFDPMGPALKNISEEIGRAHV